MSRILKKSMLYLLGVVLMLPLFAIVAVMIIALILGITHATFDRASVIEGLKGTGIGVAVLIFLIGLPTIGGWCWERAKKL